MAGSKTATTTPLSSTTVRPLPAHDQPLYTTPPGRLEDDPVYQRHAQDWQTYHTRYVTPERFHEALRVDPDGESR